MELSLSVLRNKLQTASESFSRNVKHFHGQRYSEMEEVSGSIPQALFAPKGRNLPRKVKTPSQEEVLRNGGIAQYATGFAPKGRTYPVRQKHIHRQSSFEMTASGSRPAGFTPKVKTCATTFRHSQQHSVICIVHRSNAHLDFCLHLGGAVFKPLLGARARPPLKGDVHRDT